MDKVTGKCHICKKTVKITYCPVCDHWFCKKCRKAWFWRGMEAVKEKINGKSPGCCGPEENANGV